MSDSLPLLQVDSPQTPVAYFGGRIMTACEFTAAAERLAEALPSAACIVNLCENRYWFALAWTAACLRNQLTLLPSSRAPGVLAELERAYPHQHTLDDESVAALFATTRTSSPPGIWPAGRLPSRWHLPRERAVAITFTSGSTGLPQAHPKRWGTLMRNAQLACDEILGGRGTALVATVPAQHVYGLETSLISALAAGCPVYDGKPFFPQDVRAALASVAAPRTLVTTPTHLKALLEANVQLPALRRIVSATAPLSREQAQRCEQAWSTEVHEIYGCTEAGVIARRRTTHSEQWLTFSGGEVIQTAGGPQYRAPQLPEPVALQDLIDSSSPTQFHLRGRSAEMVKVAGKRTSLQEITRHLLAIPGVHDAAVLVLQADARPVGFIVAPELTTQHVAAALAGRMEPVFVPRPLLKVERLPRNELGKLPREALLALWRVQRP